MGAMVSILRKGLDTSLFGAAFSMAVSGPLVIRVEVMSMLVLLRTLLVVLEGLFETYYRGRRFEKDSGQEGERGAD